ncbi:hypothetical protein C2G38_2039796 [Gigaspora rosea]|uniref:Uncharacterized protein n=1 Tax=Gigaspora rosea TaxID=44941 RepID=A0A397UZV7_9GLOM|nr:hypothetical protein C2G38_2039796 [Gigaspora rosea]
MTFLNGWALKENQKLTQHEPTKKITEEINSLLETMFHTSTANPQQKMSAQQMQEELFLCAAHGEIEADNIPKIITIANWISELSKKWKTAMAMRFIEEAESSKASNMSGFSK